MTKKQAYRFHESIESLNVEIDRLLDCADRCTTRMGGETAHSAEWFGLLAQARNYWDQARLLAQPDKRQTEPVRRNLDGRYRYAG